MNQQYQYSVCVDTNAIHFMSLYLSVARDECLYPFGASGKDSVAKVSEKFSKLKYRRPSVNSLMRGLEVIYSILEGGFSVVYSDISMLELIHGRGRGKIYEDMIRQELPDRMLSRFVREEDVESELSLDELQCIKRRSEAIIPELEDAGIAISNVRRSTEVWQLALGISGAVYMGIEDSLVYAGALTMTVEHLITFDQYFRKIVNRIHQPEDDRYVQVSRVIRSLLANTLLLDDRRPENSDSILPSAPIISGTGSLKDSFK